MSPETEMRVLRVLLDIEIVIGVLAAGFMIYVILAVGYLMGGIVVVLLFALLTVIWLVVFSYYAVKRYLKRDRFRIYSKGLTLTTKRQITDDGWSSYYPVDHIAGIKMIDQYGRKLLAIEIKSLDPEKDPVTEVVQIDVSVNTEIIKSLLKIMPDHRTHELQKYPDGQDR